MVGFDTTPLAQHTDERGTFVELIKTEHGQCSFSTSEPGVTRGDHYHEHKHERFVVISGHAIIRLRYVHSDIVQMYGVNGDEPTAVDIRPMFVHNITNVGPGVLHLMIWCDTPFDVDNPDTKREWVER